MKAKEESMATYRTKNYRPTMAELRAECAQSARSAATIRELIGNLGGPAAFLAKMGRIGVTFNPHSVNAWHTGNREPAEYIRQILFLLLEKGE